MIIFLRMTLKNIIVAVVAVVFVVFVLVDIVVVSEVKIGQYI